MGLLRVVLVEPVAQNVQDAQHFIVVLEHFLKHINEVFGGDILGFVVFVFDFDLITSIWDIGATPWVMGPVAPSLIEISYVALGSMAVTGTGRATFVAGAVVAMPWEVSRAATAAASTYFWPNMRVAA